MWHTEEAEGGVNSGGRFHTRVWNFKGCLRLKKSDLTVCKFIFRVPFVGDAAPIASTQSVFPAVEEWRANSLSEIACSMNVLFAHWSPYAQRY